MKDPRYSLTGYQIKYIALISMFFDHLGILTAPYISHTCYYILRGIGRTAFPVFCFFLAEGFYYTHNRRRYFMRLILFGIISELPFDVVLHNSLNDDIPGPFTWESQNVFFTLAIGFGLMILLTKYSSYQNRLVIILLALLLAEVLHADYGAVGVCTILLFYYRKINSKEQSRGSLIFCLLPLIILSFASPVQLACIASLAPLSLYQQEKGNGWKYLFYFFYPAHLILLYALLYFVT